MGAVAAELARRELPLEGDPKRSSFRIHRDIRFSNDKRPYKTEIGTLWYRQGGGKASSGVLYFHLSPAGCFAAAAFHLPDPDTLDAIREAIRVRPGAFRTARDALSAAGLSLSKEWTLSRMPRGYEDLSGSDVADAIRLKSFAVSRPVGDEQVRSVGLVDTIVAMAADALPLLRFGWGAIDEARGAGS